MPLKNREHPFPPNGFIYFQPQTGWWSRPGATFWETVEDIIQMRRKNPQFNSQWSLDREAVADELDLFTCLRIRHDPLYCQPSEALKKKSRPNPQGWLQRVLPRRVQESAAAAVDRSENITAGIGVVIDWLGDSLEPVPVDLAQKRAAICAVCPQNGRPDFIQKLLAMAASGVKELVELKNDLALKTDYDDRLQHCQPCDCVLTLKVWTKLDFILAHTNERVMTELDPKCWIRNKDA